MPMRTAGCGLQRFGAGFFGRLSDWPLRRFPVLSAERAGLLQALETAIAARETSARARECHGE
jgi:hypothetical protein